MRKQKDGVLRYAIYLRCSTDDQAENDYSTIDTQRELNTEFVKQQGGVIVGEYADEGKTGRNLKRPGWRRMLNDAQAGKFDRVCVTYLSRLGRGDASTVAEYLLSESKVEVVFVKEKFTADMAGFMNKQVTRLADAMYSENVLNWTVTKMEQMFRNGFFCGGGIPFGYQTQEVAELAGLRNGKNPPKRLVPHPEDAPLVRHAFELFALTKNATDVLEYLRKTTERTWNYTKVTYLLRNNVYRGVYQWRGLTNEEAHEPIISEGLWDMVQEALERNAEARTRRPKKDPVDKFAYYFRSIVYCPHCGSRMTPADHHGKVTTVRYYQCIQAGKQGRKNCPSRYINARSLHETILYEINRVTQHPTRLAEVVREAVKLLPKEEGLQEQISHVNRRIREVDKRIKNLMDAIETGSRAIVTLSRQLEEREAERQELKREQSRLEQEILASKIQRPDADELRAAYLRFAELWEAATEEERMELLPILVERVEMDNKEHGRFRLALDIDISAFNFAVSRGERGNKVNLRDVARRYHEPYRPRFVVVSAKVEKGGRNRRSKASGSRLIIEA